MNKSKGAAEEKVGDVSTSSSLPEDQDFELTAEMMIHDFDDEATLNEDEDDIEEATEELANLTKEGEMPLDQLLALYYGQAKTEMGSDHSSDSRQSGAAGMSENGDGGRKEGHEEPARSPQATSDSDDDEDQEKFVLHIFEKKKPRIGKEYQATKIPDFGNDESDSQENDKCNDLQVWSPLNLPEDVVVEFLKKVADNGYSTTTIARKGDNDNNASSSIVQDNEDALFLLEQCENDPKEAFKQYKSRPPPINNELQVWSEEECTQFEDGLAMYGKDFHMIHLNKVSTRSVLEIVKFYYIWKKSERFEQFSAKTRLGKKKELLLANVTDYLGRHTEEGDKKASVSSSVRNDSGNYLKYCAHSVALLEHWKQLEDQSN